MSNKKQFYCDPRQVSIWDYLGQAPIDMIDPATETERVIREKQSNDSSANAEKYIKNKPRTTRANNSSAMLFPRELLPKMRRMDRSLKSSGTPLHKLQANAA